MPRFVCSVCSCSIEACSIHVRSIDVCSTSVYSVAFIYSLCNMDSKATAANTGQLLTAAVHAHDTPGCYILKQMQLHFSQQQSCILAYSKDTSSNRIKHEVSTN